MYAPTPPAQHAAPLAPVGILTTEAPVQAQPPLHTSLSAHRSKLNVLDDHVSTVTGVLRASRGAGLTEKTVSLQVLKGTRWWTVAQTRTGRGGRYRLRYTPRQAISERARLRFGGDGGDQPSHRLLGRLNVFRLAEASWYGGGGGLACGGELTSSTLGVANKTLPCGTLVTLRYGSRSVRVPVVDRGPYVAGREFDLTEATKRALGFGDTGEVWSTR
jgi:rare lipoprotein A